VKILVIGGAGFIGSHTVDALVQAGHEVRIFDNLEPQVHGAGGRPPSYLNREAEFILGDIRDKEALAAALDGMQAVFQLAAATGVGQSMYQVAKYTEVNIAGTANLLDLLIRNRACAIEKFILASSRAVYGEGASICKQCGKVFPRIRSLQRLNQQRWDAICPQCGDSVQPLPTAEDSPANPASVYAITKKVQEELCLCVSNAYPIPITILRYFNVYGPRQSLSNPYTGIITTFITRLLNGKRLQIYEDGLMTRDFVHVVDVVRANLLALEADSAAGEVFNVGTQNSTSILELAQLIIEQLENVLVPCPPGTRDSQIEVIGKFRVGDVHHCTADISKARRLLNYEPQIPTVREGIADVLEVAQQSKLVQWSDQTEQAKEELLAQGLFR
jgi:dTDP-L-rhamnose 4-epimerase